MPREIIQVEPPRRLAPTGGVDNLRKQADMEDANTWRCAIADCDRPKTRRAAKGMCAHHYGRERFMAQPLHPCPFNGCEKLTRHRQCPKHYQASVPEAERKRIKRYGITTARFSEIVESQGGGCAVCGVSATEASHPLVVDHDHRCCPGRSTCGSCIRGVLCRECNVGLGHLRDDPDLILKAHRYLTR